jgi:hypothetical protein
LCDQIGNELISGGNENKINDKISKKGNHKNETDFKSKMVTKIEIGLSSDPIWNDFETLNNNYRNKLHCLSVSNIFSSGTRDGRQNDGVSQKSIRKIDTLIHLRNEDIAGCQTCSNMKISICTVSRNIFRWIQLLLVSILFPTSCLILIYDDELNELKLYLYLLNCNESCICKTMYALDRIDDHKGLRATSTT